MLNFPQLMAQLKAWHDAIARWIRGVEMKPELLKACTIIDRMRMRIQLPMDEQITRKEIEEFFNEVGYITQIDREMHGKA